MDGTVHEIAADVYRISTFHPGYGIQFNQFLFEHDEPFLMHTGLKKMFAPARPKPFRIIPRRPWLCS